MLHNRLNSDIHLLMSLFENLFENLIESILLLILNWSSHESMSQKRLLRHSGPAIEYIEKFAD